MTMHILQVSSINVEDNSKGCFVLQAQAIQHYIG